MIKVSIDRKSPPAICDEVTRGLLGSNHVKDVRESYDETKFYSFPNSHFKNYVCSKLKSAQIGLL